jgi:hypothetical protein
MGSPNTIWPQPNPSIFNGETFPDFVYSLVQRIKSGVKASVVKVKYVPACEKSENPVMSFHVDEYLLDRATDRNNNVPQNVHRIPPPEKMIFQSWKTGADGRGYHGRYTACSRRRASVAASDCGHAKKLQRLG